MCMSQAPKPSKKDKMKAKKVAARANDPANHDAKHAYDKKGHGEGNGHRDANAGQANGGSPERKASSEERSHLGFRNEGP